MWRGRRAYRERTEPSSSCCIHQPTDEVIVFCCQWNAFTELHASTFCHDLSAGKWNLALPLETLPIDPGSASLPDRQVIEVGAQIKQQIVHFGGELPFQLGSRIRHRWPFLRRDQ